jgi:hypothetical protein
MSRSNMSGWLIIAVCCAPFALFSSKDKPVAHTAEPVKAERMVTIAPVETAKPLPPATIAPIEKAKPLPPVTVEKAEKVEKVEKVEKKNAGKKVAKVYFKNCTAARAAGYSDMLRGEPGYASKLDRDHDGIACETSGWNS